MQKVSSQEFHSGLARAGRKSRLPLHVTFELSYGCNLRCLHCLNPTHAVSRRELSFGEIGRILSESAEIGALDVCFTGGEPFLTPRYFDILERAASLGLLTVMNTNGTRITPAAAKRLEALAVGKIDVSIYGATEETYERVTGAAGSFARFLAGLDALSATRLSVGLQMPIMKANRAEVAAARELARARGLGFMPSVDIYPRQDGGLEPLRQRLSPDEKVAVLAELGALERHGGSCGKGEAPFIDCDCGQVQFAVTPYGEMNLCTIFPHPKYDLRLGSVREGWEVLKKTVDEAKPNQNYECPSCELRSHCRQGRVDSWLEKRDMSACLPHYKRLAGLEKDLDPERALA